MTASGPKDRRRFVRHEARKPIAVHFDDRAFLCAMLDISAGGALFKSYELPRLGEWVTVNIPALGSISARVVRIIPRGFAVEFDEEDSVRCELWAYLKVMELEGISFDEMEDHLFHGDQLKLIPTETVA